MTFTLSRDQFDTLLLMAGFAIGAAINANQRPFAKRFVELTNDINKDNPGFEPYQLLPSGRLARMKRQ